LISLWYVRYLHFDDFEMTGLCSTGGSNADNYLSIVGAVAGYQNPGFVERNYIHGWTYVSVANGGPGQGGPSGFQGYNQNYGFTYQFNVVDGSDSDDHALNAFGENGDGYILQYNVARYTGGTNINDACHILHDNLFEYIYNVTDGSTHTDIWFCAGEANNGTYAGDGTPNLFYNNIFRNIPAPVSAVLMLGGTTSNGPDYVFNNLFHDYYGENTNYNDFCEAGSCGSFVIFNNTAEASLPDYAGCIWCNGSSAPTITSVNNHWITNNGTTPAAVFAYTGPVTESTTVYQTYSAATGQGYTSSNDFAPTSSSSATVTASGTNETSGYCAALNNSTAQAACESGTTNGCAYNSTSHTVSCPAITANARPASAAWNVGAYQYSGGGAPAPPTNVVEASH
jgi:hypothetical protein